MTFFIWDRSDRINAKILVLAVKYDCTWGRGDVCERGLI